MSGVGGWVRRILLILLIVLDLAMLLFWWLGGQFVFFWVFVGINACVITGEIVSVIITGKTLSTNTTKTIEAGGKKRLYIYLALVTFMLAMSALVGHLVVTGP